MHLLSAWQCFKLFYIYYLILTSWQLITVDIITNPKSDIEKTEAQKLNTLVKVIQLLISSYKT